VFNDRQEAFGGYFVEKMRLEKVKRMARTLVEMFPEKFSSDYEKNKEILREVVELSSKNLRNQLAGSIANLLKSEGTQIA